MPAELVTCIQVTGGVLTVIIALIAIIIAIRVEGRTNSRFNSQLELANQVAIANAKPILAVIPSDYTHLKSVGLSNYGVGTAIITNISFSKGDRVKDGLWKLFDLQADLPPGSKEVEWDHYWTFGNREYYLRAGQDIQLVKLSEEILSDQKFSASNVVTILNSYRQQLKGIGVEITYKDIFGNKQPVYKRILQ